ncbi:MAG: VanZ family protein [Lachnospiraceae bacterium]
MSDYIGYISNDIIKSIWMLKSAFAKGTIVYVVLLLFLFLIRKRKAVSWKWLAEYLFCVYIMELLQITGIFELKFGLENLSCHLIPFINSSIVPVILNCVLFVPYGFLLPIVFPSEKWSWKKALLIGALTSGFIELLQAFGGRFSEIDDILMNAYGTLAGYICYTVVWEIQKNWKKSVHSFLALLLSFMICFTGIYLVGENDSMQDDTLEYGIEPVQAYILETNLYAEGEKKSGDTASELYADFECQLINCGGHRFKPQKISQKELPNQKNCCIEVVFTSPQTLTLREDFSISDVDHLLYDYDQNALYWGKAGYQNSVDFMDLDSELQKHKDEVAEDYQRIKKEILKEFQ